MVQDTNYSFMIFQDQLSEHLKYVRQQLKSCAHPGSHPGKYSERARTCVGVRACATEFRV